MSVIGDFTVPAAAFALDHALSADTEMRLQADRLATHGPNEVFPFLWATGGDFQRFHQALEEDASVTNVSVAEDTADEVLYRLTWSQSFMDLVAAMVDHHAAIVEASASDGAWRLKLRFAEEGMVSEFQRHFQERGHQFEVHQLSRPTEPRQREFGLTEEQYDALVLAVGDGYYGIPRTTSVEKLGEELGVSANSVSQRLRRGTEELVRNALTLSSDESE